MKPETLMRALNDVDDELLADMEQPVRRRFPMRRALALCAALVLMLCAVTALAAGNEDVNALLYRFWPAMAQGLKPVNLSCEDQGIRMEVISGAVEGKEVRVYLSLQDTTGDRLDDSMDLFDSAVLHLPYTGTGMCTQVSYDPQTRTATFLLMMQFEQEVTAQGKATFSVSSFLAHKEHVTVDLASLVDLNTLPDTANTMSMPRLRGCGYGFPQDMETAAVQEAIAQQQVLSTDSSLNIPVAEGVTLTNVGWVDGILHVQMLYTDIGRTDTNGFVTLLDSTRKTYAMGLPITVEGVDGELNAVDWYAETDAESAEDNALRRRDSYQEHFISVSREALAGVTLMGDFTVGIPAVNGNWSVTFPLEQMME